MSTWVALLARSDDTTDDFGAVREVFSAVTNVWGHESSPNQATRLREGRYASPVSLVLSLYPHAAVVAGNRVTIGGVTYAILGGDFTGDIWHADLMEVV